MEEKIIDVVTGMAEDGITAPTNWVAVFTSKRAIFLKVSKHTVVETLSPLANRVSSSYEVKDLASSLKGMTTDQILKTDFEKVIFTADNSNELHLVERPASFFRSKITFLLGNNKVKLKMYKDTIRSVKSLLQMISPNDFAFKIKPLHSVNYSKNISYAIRSIGLIILLWSLVGMVHKVGIMGVLLVIAGFFILLKRKIGIYIIAFTMVIDLLLMKLLASGIDIEILLKNIIELIILAGIFAFLWNSRKELR